MNFLGRPKGLIFISLTCLFNLFLPDLIFL